MEKLKEYIYVILLLTIIVIITFYKVYDGQMVFVSGDSLSPIAIREGIKYFIAHNLSYPLWLPWIFSGMPSIHSFTNISDLYYPQQFFLLLNNIGLPWIWNFLLHMIFSGIGMYVLMRSFSCSMIASLISASLLMVSPYMVAMTAFGHGSQIMTASYIPFIMYYLFKLFNKRKLIDLLIFSILLGFQLQRGHIQIAYYTWMMIGLFILLYNFNSIKERGIDSFSLIKDNIYVIISLILGLLLSSNIYIPVLNYMNNSTRNAVLNDQALEYATQWSFSIKESLTMLIPYSKGFGGQTYFGDMPFTDYPNYLGILVLFLALIGFFKSTLNKNYKIFFLLVALFSFLISLGHNFISFYKIFYYWFPFFDRFRVPVYILVLFYFSVFFFMGFGLDVLINDIKTKKYKYYRYSILTFIFFSLLMLFLYPQYITSELSELVFLDLIYITIGLILFIVSIETFKKYNLNNHYIYLILGLILLFDYTRVNFEIINPKKHIPNKIILKNKDYIKNFLKKDEIATYLLDDPDYFRVFDILGPQNRWSQFNIDNVNGYHPAKLNNYSKLINILNEKGYSLWPESILKLLNVKYLIMPYDDFTYPGFKKVKSTDMYYFGYDPRYDGKIIKSHIYLYENFYQRFFFTKEIKKEDEDTIYNILVSDGFDPKEISYIDINDFSDIDFKYEEDAIITISSMSADNIHFQTKSSHTQFLVMSEIFYEDGWTLQDDDKNYKIYKVNNILRGALIPPGEHNFKMTFKPNDVIIGKYISLSIFILILVSIFIVKRKDYERI